MKEEFSRTGLIFGEEGMAKLARSRVAVFGLGGVGGYTVEALARSGVGAIDVIDADYVSVSNINRQIFAVQSTVGRLKTQVASERIKQINPDCKVTEHALFFLPETADKIDFTVYDYAVDAIDTVAGKIAIAVCAKRAGVPVISCMGAGNKLDPTAFKVTDIYKTSACPLAERERVSDGKREIPASVPFVPPVAGLICAGEVIKDILKSGGGK